MRTVKSIQSVLGIVLLAGAVGCNSNNLNTLPATHSEIHYQGGEAPPVDILWVVDDSGSMSQEQSKLAANFQQFIQYFESLHLDFHIAIVTTDTFAASESGHFMGSTPVLTPTTPNYTQLFQQMVNVGTSGSGIERGLQGARMGLCWSIDPNGATYNTYCKAYGVTAYPGANQASGFLRDNAVLAVIVVSDEDDQTIDLATTANPTSQTQADDPAWRAANDEPVSDITNFFLALKGGNPAMVQLSAITGDVPNGCVSSDANAKAGTRYWDAANALNGIHPSICATDFGPILDELGSEVAGLATGFPTQYTPYVDTITVKVNGVVIPEVGGSVTSGWLWNATINGIQFTPDMVPPDCAVVEIDYQVKDTGGPITTGNNEAPPAQCSTVVPTIAAGSLQGGMFSCDVSALAKGGATPAMLAFLGLAGLVFVRRRRT